MQKKPPANQSLDEDVILWQRVIQNVTPISGRQEKASFQEYPRHPSIKAVSADKKTPSKVIQDESQLALQETAKPIDLRKGNRAGLDGRTQRRLFRGDVTIDRRLDLHGNTAARAQIKLQSFIEDSAYSGCRCVLVITGKGSGVLQRLVPDWIKSEKLSGLVLALAEAHKTDGGSGALYVLLRRRR